jgi:hypothetical protein
MRNNGPQIPLASIWGNRIKIQKMLLRQAPSNHTRMMTNHDDQASCTCCCTHTYGSVIALSSHLWAACIHQPARWQLSKAQAGTCHTKLLSTCNSCTAASVSTGSPQGGPLIVSSDKTIYILTCILPCAVPLSCNLAVRLVCQCCCFQQ